MIVVFSLNCLHSFTTKSELEPHKKVCDSIDFCNMIMSSEDTKILESNENLIKHHLLFMQS